MCRSVLDHEWESRRAVATGTHPTMGRYVRYVVRCAQCAAARTETVWLDWPLAEAVGPIRTDRRMTR